MPLKFHTSSHLLGLFYDFLRAYGYTHGYLIAESELFSIHLEFLSPGPSGHLKIISQRSSDVKMGIEIDWLLKKNLL